MGSRRFRTPGRVFLPSLDRDDHEICPSSLQSEKRTQRPKLVAIAESPLRCDSAGSARRLRRPCRCCYRPLLRPAIRRNLAVASDRHLTTSRGPRDEALRNNATPTEGSEGKVQARGSWPEYSGFEIPWSGRAPHGCVEAQLRKTLCFLCVLSVPLVRQAKPGQSCWMKGVSHVNCSFAHVADGAAS